MTEPVRVDGVLLSTADAAYLAEALRQFAQVAALQGYKPARRVIALRAQLAAAVSDATPVVGVRSSVPLEVCVPSSGYDEYATSDAARVLGCSEGNARDLARRGALPARRAGGRWFFDRDAVQERARRSR